MITLLQGDCRDTLSTLPAQSVQTIVTSPPYYGLRSYLPADHPDKAREIGQEAKPDCLAWARGEPPCGECYVCALRSVFAGLYRVLRDDGTAWLNLGDSYAGNGDKNHREGGIVPGKNLLCIPARVALALQSDGWILRSDIVWNKPNAMPESVTDRPTKAHEYIYLLSKSPRYYYDALAIAENSTGNTSATGGSFKRSGNKRSMAMFPGAMPTHRDDRPDVDYNGATRNARTVWEISTHPYAGAHFAVFPEAIADRCIRAGSPPKACPVCGAGWRRVVEREPATKTERNEPYAIASGMGERPQLFTRRNAAAAAAAAAAGWRCPGNDGTGRSVVLDPFGGSGTVAQVAMRLGRDAVSIELNPEYIPLQARRTESVQAMLPELT